MPPSAKSPREEMHTRTYTIIGIVYLLIANTTTVNRDADLNYRMFVLGASSYVFAEGAYHMRETARLYQLRPEGRVWSHPDFIYHSIKAISGTFFFGMIFGLTELMSAMQIFYELFALAGRLIFSPPS